MSFSLMSVAILFICLVIAAIEVYRGVRNGFRKSLISMGTVVLSIVLSMTFSPLIAKLITFIAFRLVVSKISVYQNLLSMLSSLDVLIQAVVSIVLSTVIFIGLFFVIRLILNIVIKILLECTRKRKSAQPEYKVEEHSYFDRHSKQLGGIVGGITAIMVAMLIFSPVMGWFDVANKVIDSVELVNSKMVNRVIGEKNKNAVVKYAHDISGNVLYQFGGKVMYQSVASTYMYGEKVYLYHELEAAESTVDHVMQLYREMKSAKSNTQTRVALLRELRNDVDQFRMCNGVAAEVISKGSHAWSNGEKFFGVSTPAVSKLVRPTFQTLLAVCEQTNIDNVKPNVLTMMDICIVLMEYDFTYLNTDDYEQVMDVLTNTDIIARLDAVLAANPNMSGISVSSLAMTAVSSQILIEDYHPGECDVLMENIADAVNSVFSKGYGSTEERAEALAQYAVKYMEEYGVPASTVVAEMAAQELLNTLKISDQAVTAEDVYAVFEKFTNH